MLSQSNNFFSCTARAANFPFVAYIQCNQSLAIIALASIVLIQLQTQVYLRTPHMICSCQQVIYQGRHIEAASLGVGLQLPLSLLPHSEGGGVINCGSGELHIEGGLLR